MQRIVSIALSVLSVLLVGASACMTYIAGYYLDEYETYAQPLKFSIFFFLAEFVLIIINVVLLALLLGDFSKRKRLLVVSQTILVTLILCLTVILYSDFDKTRDKIQENNGDVNLFLSQYSEL